jgi:Flp pilus assembly protein CpaB
VAGNSVDGMEQLRTQVSDFVRSLTWHRRLLAAGLAAAGTALAIDAASPAPPETTTVLVAASAVKGGTVLGSEHIEAAEIDPALVPDGALTRDQAIARTLAGPMNPGEILTTTRVVGKDILSGWGADVVAVPIRLIDASASGLLRHGDRIDIIAARADGSERTDVIAESVPVLTVTTDESDTIGSGGDLVVVAASANQASAIAAAITSGQLSYALRSSAP